MQYYTCPECGQNLDPGEKCDCQREGNKKSPSDKDAKGSKEKSLIYSIA